MGVLRLKTRRSSVTAKARPSRSLLVKLRKKWINNLQDEPHPRVSFVLRHNGDETGLWKLYQMARPKRGTSDSLQRGASVDVPQRVVSTTISVGRFQSVQEKGVSGKSMSVVVILSVLALFVCRSNRSRAL